jgi:hypothetical protein
MHTVAEVEAGVTVSSCCLVDTLQQSLTSVVLYCCALAAARGRSHSYNADSPTSAGGSRAAAVAASAAAAAAATSGGLGRAQPPVLTVVAFCLESRSLPRSVRIPLYHVNSPCFSSNSSGTSEYVYCSPAADALRAAGAGFLRSKQRTNQGSLGISQAPRPPVQWKWRHCRKHSQERGMRSPQCISVALAASLQAGNMGLSQIAPKYP